MKLETLLLIFFFICTSAFAESRQLPLRSINYLSYYDKGEFDERFPGTPITGNQPSEKGHYLVYEHESLIYYFGPDKSKSIVTLYKRELDRIVGLVKDKRESLKTAKTYLVKLPRDEVGAQSPESKAAEATSENTAKPKPKPWWKRLFGW